MRYSIVIPVYNSGEWIKCLVKHIITVMNERVEGKYEIILINDASPDFSTWSKLKDVCKTFENITIINLQYNAGQLNALMCGFKYASGEYIITMDDDFQHDPEEIPKLVNKIIETKCDCVIGQYAEKKHGFIRRIGSRLSNKLSEKIYGKPKDITSNSFRIINRKTIEAMLTYKGRKPQLGPMLFSITQNIETIVIKHKERLYGNSGYKMSKLISETLNVVINASTFPLDLVSIGGVVVAGGSFLVGIVYFILYIAGEIAVPGFTAQILVTTCLSGMIILSIGIVGKYIGRIVKEVIGFPAYLERDIITSSSIHDEGE